MSTWHAAEDMTFEQALQRLSDQVYTPGSTHASLLYGAQAIGLAYGMSPRDVFECAWADAAIAAMAPCDDLLRIYPDWCRVKGAEI